MDLTTLFGKYHEDEFELRKRNDLQKQMKRSKNQSDEDINLLVRKFPT